VICPTYKFVKEIGKEIIYHIPCREYQHAQELEQGRRRSLYQNASQSCGGNQSSQQFLIGPDVGRQTNFARRLLIRSADIFERKKEILLIVPPSI